MHEQLLHDVLLGAEDASALSRELDGATIATGLHVSSVRITDLENGEHQVTAAQLVKLCDAVCSGSLESSKLEVVAFSLIASDYFQWDRGTDDGARVARVLDDWSGTEIGYPLTPSNVSKARHYLATGEDTFTPNDLGAQPKAE